MSEHTVPAFTEANRRRVDPNACACRVDDGEIIYCALHAAAPKLLAALERMRRISPERLIGWRDAHAAEECGQLDCPYCYTDEAIKEAKGE